MSFEPKTPFFHEVAMDPSTNEKFCSKIFISWSQWFFKNWEPQALSIPKSEVPQKPSYSVATIHAKNYLDPILGSPKCLLSYEIIKNLKF